MNDPEPWDGSTSSSAQSFQRNKLGSEEPLCFGYNCYFWRRRPRELSGELAHKDCN